ncbi:MAG: S8 family serine peptidase [Ignavibacteria bacterium]|nr:S8 family serine peptidase [Ignavibacteria bacterium]
MFRILILVFLSSTIIFGGRYRIFFKDKGNEEFYPNSRLYIDALNSISQRTKERRLKVLPQENYITYEDVPINSQYLEELSRRNLKILLKLKWLNYVVVEADESQINEIKNLPFIRLVQPIGNKVPKEFTNKLAVKDVKNFIANAFFVPNFNDSYYGESLNQLKMLGIDKLNSLGLFGDSVIIGIMDTGFRVKSHSGFDYADILSEYDFLYQDFTTANEAQDSANQDLHGTMVFSILGGLMPGKLVGSAPFASFILAKTETINEETHFEEDCYASAVEWMDSLGVDIITSSLGYMKFDSSEQSYSFSDFDGKTTLVSAYANRANKLGIVMVSSAGNKGPSDSTIQAPAEALGVMAIGGVNRTGDTVLKFSSRGPTADGRIKPDFVAQATSVVSFAPGKPDTLIYGSGTSVASPLFAGGTALLLSAFEELTPNEILSNLKKFSSNKENPNYSFGFGIPDFYQTAISHDILISHPITFPFDNKQRVAFKIKFGHPIDSVFLYTKNSKEIAFVRRLMNYSEAGDYYFTDLQSNFMYDTFNIFVKVQSKNGTQRRKPFNENKYFSIVTNTRSKNTLFFGNEILKALDFSNLNKNPFSSTPSTFLEGKEEITFELSTDGATEFELYLLDALGRIVLRKKYQNIYGNTYIGKINIINLPSGPYSILIKKQNLEYEFLRFFKIR